MKAFEFYFGELMNIIKFLFALVLTISATVYSIYEGVWFVSLLYWSILIGYILVIYNKSKKELKIIEYAERNNIRYEFAKSLLKDRGEI